MNVIDVDLVPAVTFNIIDFELV